MYFEKTNYFQENLQIILTKITHYQQKIYYKCSERI